MEKATAGPRDDDDAGGDGPAPVELKKPDEIKGDTLQTPHDPDVTYSGHKGKLRVRREKRVKLAVYLKAAGCNLRRALRWWTQGPGPALEGAAGLA